MMTTMPLPQLTCDSNEKCGGDVEYGALFRIQRTRYIRPSKHLGIDFAVQRTALPHNILFLNVVVDELGGGGGVRGEGGGGEVQIFSPQERMTFRTDRRHFGK